MTDTTIAKIQEQLRILLQLTQTEAQIAQIRVAQARTDAVSIKLLTQNASNAENRAQAHRRHDLQELGGFPDVVSPAFGRVLAMVKSRRGADRAARRGPARRPLARAPGPRPGALPQGARGETAKQAKKSSALPSASSPPTPRRSTGSPPCWPRRPWADPSALQATPFQRVAGGATRLVNLPGRFRRPEQVNRTVNSVQQTGEQTAAPRSTASTRKTTAFTGAVRDVLTTGRNASLQRAEKLAQKGDGDKKTAKAVHETRRDLGALDARRAADQEVRHAQRRGRRQGGREKLIESPEDSARSSVLRRPTTRAAAS